METLSLAAAILASLCASAFFSGTETGLLAIGRERVNHLVRKGSKRAKMIQRALADMGQTTTTILIANNLANVSYSTASSALIFALTTNPFARSAACLLSACIVLYFGEFMPKLLFSARPLRRTLLIAPVFQDVSALLGPFTWIAMKLTNALMPSPKTEQKLTTSEILDIIRDRRDGVRLSDFEYALITEILSLRIRGRPVTKEKLFAALNLLDKPAAKPCQNPPASTNSIPPIRHSTRPIREPSPHSSEYIVKPGDTLGHIAAHHDCTLRELASANGFFLSQLPVIRVGQRLIIPRPKQ